MIPVPATIHQLPVIQHAVEFSLMLLTLLLYTYSGVYYTAVCTPENTHTTNDTKTHKAFIRWIDWLKGAACKQLADACSPVSWVVVSYSSEASF